MLGVEEIEDEGEDACDVLVDAELLEDLDELLGFGAGEGGGFGMEELVELLDGVLLVRGEDGECFVLDDVEGLVVVFLLLLLLEDVLVPDC